jgi:hypothetical protein
MTVKELCEELERCCQPGDEVKAFDPNSMQIERVTGFLYGGRDGIVELQTDDPS